MEFIKPNKFIKKNKFYPSKKMGQNFLIDQDVLNKIEQSVRSIDTDAIIEIGPGLGSLTIKLIKLNKSLYLIELDKRLYEYLNTRLSSINNIKIVNDDALKYDWDLIASQYDNCVVIANLPYSISTLLIIKFLKTKGIKQMNCMLQKEVVDRLVSKPNCHEYNAFSCLFQHQAKVKKLINVKPSSFIPSPKVDSVFIEIIKKEGIQYDKEYDKFLKLLFLARRKTMFNNLKNKYSVNLINEIYSKFDLDKTIRSEVFDESTLYKIYNFIKSKT